MAKYLGLKSIERHLGDAETKNLEYQEELLGGVHCYAPSPTRYRTCSAR